MTIESLKGLSLRPIEQGQQTLNPKGILSGHSVSKFGPTDQNMDRTVERQGDDKCLTCCLDCVSVCCGIFFALCCGRGRIR